MSKFRKVDAGMSFGPFGYLKSGSPGNRLDVEFQYDLQPDYFDVITNGGSSPTVVLNPNARDVFLISNSTTNDESAELRSYPVPYTPGNGQEIDFTGVLDAQGIGGGTAELFLTSSVTGTSLDEVMPQSQWLNGNDTGIDWDKSHIFRFSFQSLRVGTIKFEMVRNGEPTLLGTIHNDNKRGAGYWQTPNLSVSYKQYVKDGMSIMEMKYGDDENAIGVRYKTTANAFATMKAICCTVKSIGGASLGELTGVRRTAYRDSSQSISVSNAGWVPIISIRSKQIYNSLPNLILAVINNVWVQSTTSILLRLRVDGTLTGASWQEVQSDATISSVEYDITATAVTGGREIFSDALAAISSGPPSNRQGGNEGKNVLGKQPMWARKDNSPRNLTGIITLEAIATTGTASDVYAGFNYEEIR